MNTVLICGGEINDEFSLVCLKQIKPDCIIGVDKGLDFATEIMSFQVGFYAILNQHFQRGDRLV